MWRSEERQSPARLAEAHLLASDAGDALWLRKTLTLARFCDRNLGRDHLHDELIVPFGTWDLPRLDDMARRCRPSPGVSAQHRRSR